MLNPSQMMGAATGGGQKPTGPSGANAGTPGQSPKPGQGQRSEPAEQGAPSQGVQAAQQAAEMPTSAMPSEQGSAASSGEAKEDNKSGYEALPKELRNATGDESEEEEGDSQNIGHEDFLELMMTQLENQDPMDPQDSDQMMGQIAQFTTASGVEQLQSDFEKFFEHMRSDQSLRAAQLVGREVVTESRQARLPEEGEMEALLALERSAPNLTVEIENEAGEQVHREQLGEMEAGEHTFTWDGTTEDGQRLPQGQYQLNAYVEDGDKQESVPTLVGAPVTSVSVGRDGQPPELSVAGLGEMSLSEVQRIR
ncbi:MAG: flagellar hook assembly protein FlgD [Halorhodospira sp.]